MSREGIVQYLKSVGGHLTDSTGSAGKILMERAGISYSSGMNTLKQLETEGIIERVVGNGGRRTYRIALTGVELPPMPERTSAPSRPRTPRKKVEPASADEVAESLLKLVLETIDAQASTHVDAGAREALKDRLEQAESTINSLRDELSQLQAKNRRINEERNDVSQEANRHKKANQRLAAQIQELNAKIIKLELGVANRPGVKIEDRLDPNSKAVLDSVRNKK